jgi:hypothetical protein
VRQRRSLEGKIKKLERRAGLQGPEKIPSDLQTVYFYEYDPAKGETLEQVDEKIRAKRDELVERYGRGILNKLHFIPCELVSAENRRTPESLP